MKWSAYKNGEPIGFWMSVIRQICQIADTVICYVGWLWPLWDGKPQTIADKIASTVWLPGNATAT